jgi:hypothetical protein
MKRLAIDPGDIHVGWAYCRGVPEAAIYTDHVTTGEWRPTECTTEIVHLMTKNGIDELILEEFRLYDSPEGRDQVWSSMKTSQLIGALKLIASWFRIPVIEQGAYIKTPTRNQLRARKIKQKGVGTHALDAELHLYYRMLREGN